jgi:hypothetical protein
MSDNDGTPNGWSYWTVTSSERTSRPSTITRKVHFPFREPVRLGGLQDFVQEGFGHIPGEQAIAILREHGRIRNRGESDAASVSPRRGRRAPAARHPAPWSAS